MQLERRSRGKYACLSLLEGAPAGPHPLGCAGREDPCQYGLSLARILLSRRFGAQGPCRESRKVLKLDKHYAGSEVRKVLSGKE